MIPTSSFSWSTGHQGCALSPRFKWNGDILDINEIVQRLGPKTCSQLLGIHALSGCDTVSYPFGKGKKSALKLLEINIPGLDQVLGQPGAIHVQLQETAYTFFLPLYGPKGCTTMNDARAHFYRCHKKPPPVKKRPPTDANLLLHVLRSHLQMLLWKAADQRDPPVEAQNIANFGWNIEGSAITRAVSTAPVAPQALLDVISCSCTAAQAFHARTTANTREETSAVVLSSASRWISKMVKGRQETMINKYTLYFLVIYSVYTCISKWLTNKFKLTYVLFP